MQNLGIAINAGMDELARIKQSERQDKMAARDDERFKMEQTREQERLAEVGRQNQERDRVKGLDEFRAGLTKHEGIKPHQRAMYEREYFANQGRGKDAEDADNRYIAESKKYLLGSKSIADMQERYKSVPDGYELGVVEGKGGKQVGLMRDGKVVHDLGKYDTDENALAAIKAMVDGNLDQHLKGVAKEKLDKRKAEANITRDLAGAAESGQRVAESKEKAKVEKENREQKMGLEEFQRLTTETPTTKAGQDALIVAREKAARQAKYPSAAALSESLRSAAAAKERESRKYEVIKDGVSAGTLFDTKTGLPPPKSQMDIAYEKYKNDPEVTGNKMSPEEFAQRNAHRFK